MACRRTTSTLRTGKGLFVIASGVGMKTSFFLHDIDAIPVWRRRLGRVTGCYSDENQRRVVVYPGGFARLVRLQDRAAVEQGGGCLPVPGHVFRQALTEN